MGFGCVGVGNGGFSLSFSNLSPLAPPFTLDRSVTKSFSSPLVDIIEPSLGAPVNSSLHNWLPPSSQTSGPDFFANPSSEFDWLPVSSGPRYPGSQSIEPSDKHVPLLGPYSISSADASLYGNSSDSLTNSIGKAKPYYPSYASTSCNNGCSLGISDQPSYDCLSKSHAAAFDVPYCDNYSHGSSSSDRSVEEASHSIDVLGLNKCSESFRKLPNEEFLMEQTVNIMPVEDLRLSDMDAHFAFPGCHLKSKTPPLNLATISQNCQFVKNAPYQRFLREEDACLSDTTSIVSSLATFSNRPPVVSTDSLTWNIGPSKISDYGYHSAEALQGGKNLLNVKETLPFSSESRVYFDTENHDTCIDKNDPIVTESLSVKVQEIPNNVCAMKDTSSCILKAEVGRHIPDVSPHSTLGLKTIETSRTVESSSESYDQYNLSVDSPCWKGAPVSRLSSSKTSEIAIPHQAKKVETFNSMNISLPWLPHYTAEDSVKVSVYEPNGSTMNNSLEQGATSSPKISSVVSALPVEQKIGDSMKAGDFYSKMGCFYPASNNIHESVGDDSDVNLSHFVAHKHDLMFGRNIESMSCMEKHADARLHDGNSSEDGLNHLSCGVAKTVQYLPPCTEDSRSKLAKAEHEESISKTDLRLLVDATHNLSELLGAYCSNGLGKLHQRDVESLQSVMSNLDMCIKNSVAPQDSLSPKRRTPQNLGEFHQLRRNVGVTKSQVTNIEDANVQSLCDWNSAEKRNQNIFCDKKDYKAVDPLYSRNDVDLTKEDDMILGVKKVLRENFHDEGDHPQSIMYKNLWLEAEAALCVFNFRSRFNRAKLEMEKHASPRTRETAKDQDGHPQPLSDAFPGPSTTEKLASNTKVGPTSGISLQTSSSTSASTHADDVISRFHTLKCRDKTKPSIVENRGELFGSKVFVELGMVEESTLVKKRSAVPDMKDRDSPFPTLKATMENDFRAGLAPASPIITKCSHTDDVMSRFEILKSRDEQQVNAKMEKISSSNCCEVDSTALKIDGSLGPRTSVKYPPNADNNNAVDNLDASVMARLNILRNRGNHISLSPDRADLQDATFSECGRKKGYRPMTTGGVLGVEVEPFSGFDAKDSLSRKDYTRQCDVEDKFGAGCLDEPPSSDWEHVLWDE